MARPKRKEAVAQLNVYIPSELLEKIRILMVDPATGRVAHGSLSHLVTKLLRDWLNEQKRTASDAGDLYFEE